jgi:FkbM family methyltransferase
MLNSMIRTAYRTIVPERKRIQLRHVFDKALCKNFEDKVTLGERCPWTILTRDLKEDAIVYSGGVGEDISFELALIDRFGCDIQIFDPSPVGRSTIARANGLANRLHFKNVGLAGSSTPMRFQAKEWDNETFFYRDADEAVGSFREVTVPCTTIAEELAANGHARIDLLKLDIEGFEHGVLESCLNRSILPKQICVEFHHFFPNGSKSETAGTIWRLHSAGYRLIHKNYYDWTFYHRDYLGRNLKTTI